MVANDNKATWKTQILTRFRDPLQLRLFIAATVVVVGYVGIYLPLSNDIGETDRQMSAEMKRMAIIRDIEQLRVQFQRFKHRLPMQTDANEWMQYVLAGVRSFPVKLTLLDSRPPQDVGPYKAVVLRIELEGEFRDLNLFLCWLETNERFFRVDGVNITPHRKTSGLLAMQLTVMGVMGS